MVLTVEYYSAMKKNEISSIAMMWMELESTILSKISLLKKDKCGKEKGTPKNRLLTKETTWTVTGVGWCGGS